MMQIIQHDLQMLNMVMLLVIHDIISLINMPIYNLIQVLYFHNIIFNH